MIQGGFGGGSIYWSWNMPSYQNPSGCTYSLITDPNTNSFNSAEIKLHMTWDGTASSAAMDVDIYYSLQRNVSGLYASATLSHPATYPDLPGGEWRMASYPNPRFDWLSVDALRNRLMASGSDLANAAAVTGAPPEITRLTTGIYKDKYECKYDYSADFGAIDTWGWSSTADNVGLWITAPSKEYYPGGPMKRELMGHTNPVLLNMLGGTHYEQGSETAVAAGEQWQKNYGPFLIYCNKVAAGTANAPIALWENAKTQAKTEQAAWPYSWHNNPSYVKESGRGTVTGKLVINDSGNASASAADTWVGLAIPPTGSSSATDFEDWSKNYQFWVKTDANGNFSIPDVLPGTYSLFAFGPGANGQLSLSNYATVVAGTTTALGNVNWTPVRVASTIWEIGKPDRNAMEFKHGTDWWTSNTYPDTRYGIFMNYPDEFPNGVNFTIGQSNITTDWNFVHPYNKTINNESPKWNVNFNLSSAPVSGSNASVYVALAANFSAALILTVNGTNVTVPATGFAPGNNSNAMIRKGIHGAFADTRFTFPASYLKAGANQITFTLRVTGSATSGEVMYDYIRLEADLPNCNAPTFTSSPTNNNTATAANSCDAVVNYTAVASENPTYAYVFTGATTGSGTGTGSGSKFNKGTTHVAITATNSCGNATHSFDIIVSDSTKPTITAPQNLQIGSTNNNPVTGVQLGSPTVTDNCSAANNLIITNDAPASFPQGTTTVTWTVTDESGNSQTAAQQVIVTVNTAPTAVSDQVSVAEGATITTLVGGATTVLANDTDTENNTLTATLVSNVTNGTLTLNSNGTFSYVHNGSETTSDSFSYKANDGTSNSNIVTVSITVTPVNDVPIAVADAITVTEGGTVNGTTVLANDTDSDNYPLTAVLVSNVTNGNLTLNSNGTYSYVHNGSETTSDSFTYKTYDGALYSNVVTVNITVTPVNDAPIATADAISVANGGTATSLVGNITTVLANDSDAENNTLTAILMSNVSNGTLTLSSNGTFSYIHNGSNTTSDSFTYKANDGTSNSSIVTVTITIAPFTLANNNFTIESKSETCANKNNGEITINAVETYNYTAKINGTNYPFVNNSLVVSNLAPGTYSVCISIDNKFFEQCYTVVIAPGGTITAKSIISSNKIAVEIIEGTAPYNIYVNGIQKIETNSSSFDIKVKQGDLVEVKTAKPCEGVYSERIGGTLVNVIAYPNPTYGEVEIVIPTTQKQVKIELYTTNGQLISKGNYAIVDGKTQLNLSDMFTGVYIVKVNLETPVFLTIIKK
jgi:rhamnogalacturonan endolyase